MPISLIFPMAGQGARFGYRFKPFLEIDGQPFIAEAFRPFRAHLDKVAGTYFIYLAEQEAAHDVAARLDQLFAGLPHQAVILPEPTPGPSVTLRQCLERTGVTGPVIVCDCDHALDVAPIFAAAADPEVACILPTWDLTGEPIESWGVAGIEPDGRVIDIAEKALPAKGAIRRGVIGCYYFADAGEIARIIDAGGGEVYISDIVRSLIAAGRKVVSVEIDAARFFGDPARLAKATGA